MKSGQEINAIEIYATHHEGKSVVAERFIRILKNNIYKHMTSVLKNVYIDKLDDIVNKYNNTCHSTIKMKPGDVKPSTYADSSKEINNKCLNLKTGDNIRISKYKRIFTKGYVPNWSKEDFPITNVKNTVPWMYVISDLKGEKILVKSHKIELKKASQKEFRIAKVIKRKGDKLHVKWKGYRFSSLIDKKDIV